MRNFVWPSVAIVALSGSGCSTIGDLLETRNSDGQRIYGGVRRDCEHIAHPDSMAVLPSVVFGILDFPFSLGLDTVCLPVTVIFAFSVNNPSRTDVEVPAEPGPPRTFPTLKEIEGFVVQAEGNLGSRVLVIDAPVEMPPQGQPLHGARVRLFLALEMEGSDELPFRGSAKSDDRGHFMLSGKRGVPWKSIRVECEGFHPVEIPWSSYHSPADQDFWRNHRLLIRMDKQ